MKSLLVLSLLLDANFASAAITQVQPKNLRCEIYITPLALSNPTENLSFVMVLPDEDKNSNFFSTKKIVKSKDGRFEISIWSQQPKQVSPGVADYVGVELADKKLGVIASAAESAPSVRQSNIDDSGLDYTFDDQMLSVRCDLLYFPKSTN